MIKRIKRYHGYQILDTIVHIQSKLRKTKEHPRLELDETLTFLEADTNESLWPILFTVGIQELVEKPDALYSMEEAMIPIIAIFHEVYGHGYQLSHEFQKDTALSQVLALNHYACKSSVYYYGTDSNNFQQYLNQPCEIAAQYAGIKAAYRFLAEEWGERQATDAICTYMNHRILDCSDCLPWKGPYTDVKQILVDMDKVFSKSIYRHRTYSIQKSYETNDIVRGYIEHMGDSSVASAVEITRNGLKQDQMMASMYLTLRDPLNHMRDVPALSKIELDPKKAKSWFRLMVKPPPALKSVHLTELTEADLRFADELSDKIQL